LLWLQFHFARLILDWLVRNLIDPFFSVLLDLKDLGSGDRLLLGEWMIDLGGLQRVLHLMLVHGSLHVRLIHGWLKHWLLVNGNLIHRRLIHGGHILWVLVHVLLHGILNVMRNLRLVYSLVQPLRHWSLVHDYLKGRRLRRLLDHGCIRSYLDFLPLGEEGLVLGRLIDHVDFEFLTGRG